MITYYIDNTTTPGAPAARPPAQQRRSHDFNNNLGTTVAFDIENLQITYDLADGVTNPANVRMTADQNGTGALRAESVLAEQHPEGQHRAVGAIARPDEGTRQFLRNRLQTQVSLRSLAFVDDTSEDERHHAP